MRLGSGLCVCWLFVVARPLQDAAMIKADTVDLSGTRLTDHDCVQVARLIRVRIALSLGVWFFSRVGTRTTRKLAVLVLD